MHCFSILNLIIPTSPSDPLPLIQGLCLLPPPFLSEPFSTWPSLILLGNGQSQMSFPLWSLCDPKVRSILSGFPIVDNDLFRYLSPLYPSPQQSTFSVYVLNVRTAPLFNSWNVCPSVRCISNTSVVCTEWELTPLPNFYKMPPSPPRNRLQELLFARTQLTLLTASNLTLEALIWPGKLQPCHYFLSFQILLSKW